MSSLEHRNVVITGAAQGLGRAYAHRIAAEGGTAILADINIDAAERVVGEIHDQGGVAHARTLNVSDQSSRAAFADWVTGEIGALHGLVNNAAIFSTITMRPFWDIPPAEWDQVLAVNLKGPFLLTAALLPALRRAETASVVHVSSDAVFLGRPGYLHYTSSKAGIIGMTYSMARELGDDGIRVNAISPGPTYTEVPRATVSDAQRQAMHAAQALHRDASPDDMVGVVSFLLGDDSRFVTGQVLSVSGGLILR